MPKQAYRDVFYGVFRNNHPIIDKCGTKLNSYRYFYFVRLLVTG